MTTRIGMTTMTATKSNRSRTRVRIRAYTRIRAGTCENACNHITGTRAPTSTKLTGTRAPTSTKLTGTRAPTRLKGIRLKGIRLKGIGALSKKDRSVLINIKDTTISVSSSSKTLYYYKCIERRKKINQIPNAFRFFFVFFNT